MDASKISVEAGSVARSGPRSLPPRGSNGFLAMLDFYFRGSAMPSVVLALLVLLLTEVGQARDIAADTLQMLSLSAIPGWESYGPVGWQACISLWCASLLLAASIGYCALVSGVRSGETLELNRSVRCSNILATIVMAVVSGAVVFAASPIRAAPIALVAAILFWMAFKGPSPRSRWRKLGESLAVVLLLVVLALELSSEVRLGFGLSLWRWFDRQADPSTRVPSALICATLVTVGLALLSPFLFGAWFRRVASAIGQGRGRAGLYGLTLATSVAVLVPWPAASMLRVGSLPVVLVWLSWLVCVITTMGLWLRRARIPAFFAVAFVVAAFVLFHREKLGDETLAPVVTADPPPIAPASAASAAVALMDRLPILSRPIVLSADGGGLRAAFFTASVLAQADDWTCGRFGEHVRAASGVSGGSIGLATWAVMRQEYVRAERRRGRLPWGECWAAQSALAPVDLPLTRLVQYTLRQDHLSMPLFGALTRDLLLPTGTAQRGQYLVDSWQGAAVAVLGAVYPDQSDWSAFAGPLRDLTAELQVPPVFAFNATEVDSGDALTMWSGPGHMDQPAELSVGVAALNSARFPIISPSATYMRSTTAVRVVDGGFFDNSGAIVLSTAMHAMDVGIPMNARYIRINGSAPVDDGRCEQFQSLLNKNPMGQIQVTSPAAEGEPPTFRSGWTAALAIDNVRTRHGEAAAAALASAETAQYKGVPLQLRLDLMRNFVGNCEATASSDAETNTTRANCINANLQICAIQVDARELPLGWYLSTNSGFMIGRIAGGEVVRLLSARDIDETMGKR